MISIEEIIPTPYTQGFMFILNDSAGSQRTEQYAVQASGSLGSWNLVAVEREAYVVCQGHDFSIFYGNVTGLLTWEGGIIFYDHNITLNHTVSSSHGC